jgi:hypothetical protein
MYYINDKLVDPEAVAEQIEQSNIKAKMRKMQRLLKLVQKFVKEHDGILYGGLALNTLLPDALKFYNDDEIPDYDFYIQDADKLSKKLADQLKNKGYNYTEVKHALHEGTFKVFSNFESVADMSMLSSVEYTLLKDKCIRKSLNGMKLLFAPIDFLKAAAYLELGLPIGASFRWTKVYKRLLLFENAYPVHVKSKIDVNKIFEQADTILIDDKHVKVHKEVKKYIKLNELMYINLSALKILFNDKLSQSVLDTTHSLQVMSLHLDKTVDDVCSLLRAYKVAYKTVHYDDFSSFIPKKSVVYIQDDNGYKKLLSIYETNEQCFSYFTIKGSMFCSMYVLFYIYYFKRLIQDANHDLISNILVELHSLLDDDDARQRIITTFTKECYGYQASLSATKKKIWDDNKKILFYRPK